MNPLNIQLTIHEQQHVVRIHPKSIVSYSRKALALGIEDDHQLHLGSLEHVVTLYLSSTRTREAYYKRIKGNQEPLLKLGSEIKGIRLVKSETAWPDQKPRVVMCQYPEREHGVDSYHLEFDPAKKEGRVVTLVRTDTATKSAAMTIWAGGEKNLLLGTEQVLINDRTRSLLVVLANSDAARRLYQDLTAGKASVIEVNDHVRAAMFAGPQSLGYRLDNLSVKDQAALKAMGAQITQKPFHYLPKSLKETVVGMGWGELAKGMN